MSRTTAVFTSLASLSVLAAGWATGMLHASDALTSASASTGSATSTSSSTSTGSSSTDSSSGSSTSNATSTESSSTATDSSDASSSDTSTSTDTASSDGSALADGTYTGASISTRYGDVQLQITVADGAITDVTALAVPSNDGHSQRISNQAIPILNSEAVSEQSADVSWVSGATYTSNAYQQSLQSALDEAAV